MAQVGLAVEAHRGRLDPAVTLHPHLARPVDHDLVDGGVAEQGLERAEPERALGHARGKPGARVVVEQAGLAVDEVSLARKFDSKDERAAALLHYLKAVVENPGRPPVHLHEEAREAGWSDEQLLEAIAYVALERFTAMVNVAGDVPVDGSVEDTRTLRAA